MDLSSDTLLLSTKLKIPAPRKNFVVRKALFEKLALCADMSVIFVRGGAGTGKTTLLSSFIHETGLKNVCWVSLDASNANIYSFWLYFTAALSALWEDGDNFLNFVRSYPDASHMEHLLTLLINRLCGGEDYYMVLDDVHCIGDAALIRTLEFFIGAMPSNFHIFMLSREDPPVYLGPLAVSGRLLYIDGKQMLLTPDEGMAFMRNTMHLSCGKEELEQLNTYAEGWIGGLQLAAAAGAAGRRSRELLRAGGGIAAEYLTRELFESLCPEERNFLIGTGFLSYFDAGICKALFDGFTDADFVRMVDALIQKNLFIICVDEENSAYRYHNILSDYLGQQFSSLPQKRSKELMMRAAAAFEQRSDSEEAMRLFCEAESYPDVLRVARALNGKIEAWSYLDKVPLDSLIGDVDLAAQCFMYNLGNLNIAHCRALYEVLRDHYGDSDLFRVLQFAEAYVSSGKGILPKYQALTAEQIERIPFGPVMKAMILVETAAALVETVQYEEAEACIGKAMEKCEGENVFVDFFIYNELAQIYEEEGRLNDSLEAYAKSRRLVNLPSILSGVGTNYYFGLVGVYMRRMELDKAAETLEHARLLMNNQHIHMDIMDVTFEYHSAEMKFLLGDDAAGAALVESIISEHSSFSLLTLGRLIHELDCAGKLRPETADEFLKELEAEEHYRHQPFMRLLRARLLFKRGETVEALRETDDVLRFSRLHKSKARLVEADLLKILILLGVGSSSGQTETMNLLREAVHYAHDDRIIMPFFLDRRSLVPMIANLAAQVKDDSMSKAETAFLHDVLAVCGCPAPAAKETESLSARELEVLGEMALGITNREIADKLCISQATVKTHVLSIFGKLGVSSRMRAVKEGRERGLIS